MFKNIFKERLTVAEAKDIAEQLKLLESYHWQRQAYHREMHDTIMKQRTVAEAELREAERRFITASLDSP